MIQATAVGGPHGAHPVGLARGYRMLSGAATMRPRLPGKSKVTDARTILANMRQLLQLRWIL